MAWWRAVKLAVLTPAVELANERLMGHTTSGFTLSVYAQAMDWSDGEHERLAALVDGSEWVRSSP